MIEKSQAGCSCQSCLLDGENVEVFVSVARLTALQQTILRAKSSVSVMGLWCLEFTFFAPGSLPFRVRYTAGLFNEPLGEGALMLAFGKYRRDCCM